MSFWSFIGGFAVFNMIFDFMFGKSDKHHYETDDTVARDNEARLAELEDELSDCDICDDRYDYLTEELDDWPEDIDDNWD